MFIDDVRKLLYKFLKSKNKNISLIRDIIVALFVVLLVLCLLWSYTGQWFAAPIVAIESGSMEHPENAPFGRLGTIDAGDMVLVQKVYSKNDIAVHGGEFGGAQSVDGWHSYGDYGDVIIYYPDGDKTKTPIIHRAMCWVEVDITNNQRLYTIEEFGIYNQSYIGPIKELGLDRSVTPDWDNSGYLTKGDNNDIFDNLPNNGILESNQPIKVEWISGKARLEIPWFGTINLLFSDIINGTNNIANVHTDCLISLIIVIIILVLIPIILDFFEYLKQKRDKQ